MSCGRSAFFVIKSLKELTEMPGNIGSSMFIKFQVQIKKKEGRSLFLTGHHKLWHWCAQTHQEPGLQAPCPQYLGLTVCLLATKSAYSFRCPPTFWNITYAELSISTYVIFNVLNTINKLFECTRRRAATRAFFNLSLLHSTVDGLFTFWKCIN